MSLMRVIAFHLCTKFVLSPLREIWRISVSPLIGQETLTFDLSTSKYYTVADSGGEANRPWPRPAHQWQLAQAGNEKVNK